MNLIYYLGPIRFAYFKFFYTDHDHIKKVDEFMYDVKRNQHDETQVKYDLQKAITHLSYIENDKVVSDYIKDHKFFAHYANDIVKLCLKSDSSSYKIVDYALASARYWKTLDNHQLSHLMKVAADQKDIDMVTYLLNKQHVILTLEDGFKVVENFKDSSINLKKLNTAINKEVDDMNNILYDFYYDNVKRSHKDHIIHHYEQVGEVINNYIAQHVKYGMIKEDLHYNDAPYIKESDLDNHYENHNEHHHDNKDWVNL